MFLRNGLKTTLRAKGRTFLFICLITVLTLSMILGAGINLYCDNAVKESNTYYKSIGVLEYMGSEYPSDTYMDSYARKAESLIPFDEIKKLDGVLDYSPNTRTLTYLPGYTRKDNNLPYKESAVLVVTHIAPLYVLRDFPCEPDTPGAKYAGDMGYVVEKEVFSHYTAVISETLYSYDSKDGIIINFIPPDDMEFSYTDRFLVHGSFISLKSSTFQNGLKTFSVKEFQDSSDKPYHLLSSKDDPLLREGVFFNYAEKYRTCNNFVTVKNASDLQYMREFHQGTLYLTSGTLPEKNDSTSCVISRDISDRLNINVGDTVTLDVLSYDDNNVFDISLTGEKLELTVSGITNDNANYTGYIFRNNPDERNILFGYTLGTFYFENDRAKECMVEIEKLLPENTRIVLYDQGYSSFVGAFETVKLTSKVILYVTGLATFTVLLLFSYLLIGRQKETVKNLIYFGTPKKDISIWMLSGTLFITAVSTLLGLVAGYFTLPAVLNLVSLLTNSLHSTSLRYSETTLGLTREFNVEPAIRIIPLILICLSVILLSLLFSYLFLKVSLKSVTRKKGVANAKGITGKTDTRRRGPIRFAMLSIKRGGLRTIVVPEVSLVLTVVIILLSSVYQGYSNTLDSSMDSISKEGYVSDLSGERYFNLALNIENARKVENLSFIENIFLSGRMDYYIPSEMPEFGSGSFAQEHQNEWIAMQPDLVMVNSLKGAREFYYTYANVTYLDGYDESIFTEDYRMIHDIYGLKSMDELPVYPAVMNSHFMESHSLSLGDEITVIARFMGERDSYVKMKAVGVYSGIGDTDNIYLPLSAYCSPELLKENPEYENSNINHIRFVKDRETLNAYLYKHLTFSTCRFFIKENVKIDNARKELMEGNYTSPGHMSSNRTTVIFRDAEIVELSNTLGRQVILGKVILVLIISVIAIISYVISHLMINGRKNEFLIMRGFGVRKKDVFLSFFLEQMILVLAGFIIGLLSLIFTKAFGMLEALSILGFLLSYALGCALEVRAIGKTNLMDLMSVKGE
ncbi:MAG: hypothetical protein MJ171_04785 [Clostridia bacterium]|nr:hypothetical protein [Clostridia bacterium]